MKHFDPIKSYYPEHLYFDRKQAEDERICTEDLAVVDVREDCRILAARGVCVFAGDDLFHAFHMAKEEFPSIYELLLSNRRVFWEADGRPLLLFADWLSETGLLLVVRPNGTVHAVREILKDLTTENFLFPQPYSIERKASRDLRAAYDVLTDIFSYTDIMFSRKSPSARRLISSIAKFAGCHIDPSSFFSLTAQNAELDLSPRTVAFLTCSLLFLREQSGIADATLPYRIALEKPAQEEKPAPKEARPAFATLSCFAQYDLCYEDGKVILKLPTGQTAGALASSNGHGYLRICIHAI